MFWAEVDGALGDDVDPHFQAHAGHAQRIGDAALVVDDEFLGQDVDDFPIERNGHGLGRVDDPLTMSRGPTSPPLTAMTPWLFEALDVAAGDAGVDRADFASGHELGLFQGLLDGLHGLLDVDHHALAQSGGGAGADAHHIHAFG